MIAKRIRFLVLRGGAIGDFVVTLPVLQAIRDRWPEAYIELIGYPHIAKLALAGGLIDQLHSLDRAGMAAFFSSQPSFSAQQVEFVRSFDLIFSFLHDVNGVVQENLELAGARQVLYGSPIVDGDLHAVDHLLKPLESLAIYSSDSVPSLTLSEEWRREGRKIVAEQGAGAPVYVLHPGSGSPRKNWPLDRYVEIAERIRREVGGVPLFLIGEADAAVRNELAEKAPTERVLENLSLLQVAGVLRACTAYVGNDSGITHIAAALGVPTVALFGPSSFHHWRPRGIHVNTLRAESDTLDDLGVDEVWMTLVRQRR